jgi:hypothetical protein
MESKLISNFLNEITFIDGCIVENDYIYLASFADEYDPNEHVFSRLFAYIGRLDDKWFHHDTKSNVVSVCVKKATATEGRRLCALSKEGEVEIYSNKDGSSITEKIPESGLRLGSRGYLTQIREIGDTLFACGANDQVYRHHDGGWMLITSSPLQILNALDPNYGVLNSIDGNNENDIYVCGFDGRLFHFDGKNWKKIPLQTDEHLNYVKCISADEVWICGYNGTLLKGNVKTGFQDISTVDDNFTFWSLAKFGESVYLSTANQGLFVYDGMSIKKVYTGLEPEIDTYKLDANEQTIWSFGTKDLSFFDGNKWTRIDHPDNPPIR